MIPTIPFQGETKVLDSAHGDNWSMYHGDSCQAVKGIPDSSVDMCIYSPPFSTLYTYSASIADMGNSEDHAEFFQHYRYLVPELLRITKPGRLCIVHCKDLPLYKGRDGAMGLYPFPDDIVRTHLECGWTFHSRVAIWKDPVTEMQRTKNHGLLYKELCKDSCGSRQGMSDYLLVFRNWNGEFNNPVTAGPERFDHYIGMEPPDPTMIALRNLEPQPRSNAKTGGWPKNNPFPVGSPAYREWSIAVWQRYASPVWHDIDQTDVLNGRLARTDADSKHICPLQQGLIERCIHLWSNPGDVVFSPFAGVSSEVHSAVKTGRKGIGIELKKEYFEQGIKFLSELEAEMDRPSLFDGIETHEEALACTA